ncbi:MAG: tetratricopeptide repeat protein, partial [Nannocystaceae bacterium]
QEGRDVPALMIYRDAWNDERAVEGVNKFLNAKRALLPNLHVAEDLIRLSATVVDVSGEGEDITLSPVHEAAFEAKPDELAEQLVKFIDELLAFNGKSPTGASWTEIFGTENRQALVSYLVGLGNLSALQGRVVPAPSEQLINPVMDAINRDPEMSAAADILHGMVDILVAGQPDRAAIPLSIQAMTIAAQRRPKDPQLSHHLAVLLRRLGDIPSAINAFNQAFNLDPSDEIVTNGFIETLRSIGDTENAMKVAQFALERGSDSPVVCAHLGALMIDGDMFDEAEPFLRRAVDEGKIPSAFGDLANVLWDRGDAETEEGIEDRTEAMSLLATAIEQPNVAKSSLDMLLDLWDEEQDERARDLLLKAGELHQESAHVLTSVASLYLDGDDPERARPVLERMLKLPRRGLDDDAFARRQLLALNLPNFDERYDAAVSAIETGADEELKQAAVFMREVIASDRMYWQPHLMLALAVRGTEGDAAALGHLNNAVKLRPNESQVRELLAAILRKLGRAADAVEHLRALVSLNPREIDPVLSLASTMRDANMFDECRAVCSSALQMLPGHQEFTKILESLPPADGEQ